MKRLWRHWDRIEKCGWVLVLGIMIAASVGR